MLSRESIELRSISLVNIYLHGRDVQFITSTKDETFHWRKKKIVPFVKNTQMFKNLDLRQSFIADHMSDLIYDQWDIQIDSVHLYKYDSRVERCQGFSSTRISKIFHVYIISDLNEVLRRLYRNPIYEYPILNKYFY